jgi:hypothetical protein
MKPASAAAWVQIAEGTKRLGTRLETSSGQASGDDNRTRPLSTTLHHNCIYATASLVKEKGKIAQQMVGLRQVVRIMPKSFNCS